MKNCVTLGYIGYFPAPGTMGTLAALPLAYGLSWLSVWLQAAALILLICVSYYIIDKVLPSFSCTDPSEIILDEVIGILVTFVGISYSPVNFCIGFIAFRFFDILKPCGIQYLEKIPGAWGILLDDIAAGLCAHFILRFWGA